MSQPRAEPPTYLLELQRLVHEDHVSSAYYLGHADFAVIDFLLSTLPFGAVHVMDPHEEQSLPEMERLFRARGLKRFTEGGGPAELVIVDDRWQFKTQLTRMIEWHGTQPPRIFFLVNDATQVDRHSAYAWESRGACLVGIRIGPCPRVGRLWETLI